MAWRHGAIPPDFLAKLRDFASFCQLHRLFAQQLLDINSRSLTAEKLCLENTPFLLQTFRGYGSKYITWNRSRNAIEKTPSIRWDISCGLGSEICFFKKNLKRWAGYHHHPSRCACPGTNVLHIAHTQDSKDSSHHQDDMKHWAPESPTLNLWWPPLHLGWGGLDPTKINIKTKKRIMLVVSLWILMVFYKPPI